MSKHKKSVSMYIICFKRYWHTHWYK